MSTGCCCCCDDGVVSNDKKGKGKNKNIMEEYEENILITVKMRGVCVFFLGFMSTCMLVA